MKLRLLAACVLPLWPLAWAGATAERLFEQAQKAERAGQIVNAYLLYAQAAAADPGNLSYWARAQALRPRATLLDASPPKPLELIEEPIDPTLFGTVTDLDIERGRRPLPPPRLHPAEGLQDFDLSGDSKALWEQVAARLKLQVVFDSQYQPTRAFRFQLSGADYRQALMALEAGTNSFLEPVSERLIFVANDNPQKRTEFESTAAVVIPLPETISVQEIQEIATGIRGVLDAQKITVDTQRHLVLIRDRVTRVRLAQKMLEDLLRPRAQVSVEVEILVTDQTSALNYGLSLPTAFPLVNFPIKTNLLQALPSGFTAFMGFGGGASLLGLGVTSAELFATVTKATSSTVLNSEVVALDGQPTTLHIGDKYPIQTNGYFGSTSGSGTVYTPPPTINFEDLGLVLKVTPHIHGTDEVSLDLEADFKLLGASAIDGIPVVSEKKYESKIRLRTGEWAVLAGLMNSSDARTLTGLPGLMAIPFLRNNTVKKDNGQTLIVLKPHIQVEPPTESPTWRAWCGTETRLPAEL